MRRYFYGLVILVLWVTGPSEAAVTPLSLSIFAPVQFPAEDFSVVGLRINVFMGRHRNVYGFDLGAISNVTQNNFAGVQAAGILNFNKGTATAIGLQAAGIANININKAKIYGLQLGMYNSNRAESTLVGLGLGVLANDSRHTTVYGAQVGLYNRARNVYGFQIGLVNATDSLHGIQIGLLNFHHKGVFSVAPIMNIGF